MKILTNINKILILASFLSIKLLASPEINVNTSYYKVKGLSQYEIREDINKKRFYHTRANYDAYTKWHVNWNFRWKKYGNSCKITDIETKVNIKIILPKLINKNQLNNDVLTKWNDYKKALIEHEDGHKDFGIQSAQEIEETLKNMPTYDCNRIESKVNKKAKSIIKKFIILEKEYDIETNHGVNNGASF